MHALMYITVLSAVGMSFFDCGTCVNSDTREEVLFPEEHPEHQEIPLALIRHINENGIASLKEFVDDFVDNEDGTLNSEISARIGSGDADRSAVQTAKLTVCMPELTRVRIVPEDSTVFYHPSCTRVQRCGGCCGHQSLSCQPVESEIIRLSVFAAEYRGGSKLKSLGYEIVEVEQHKKCKCDCRVQPEHCNKFQKYNREMCKCECENADEEVKCRKERKLKSWNRGLCSCTCRKELECSSGFYFDPVQCRCEATRNLRSNGRHKQNPWTFNFQREFYSSNGKDSREKEPGTGSVLVWGD